jgi:hypothetical protein
VIERNSEEAFLNKSLEDLFAEYPFDQIQPVKSPAAEV